MVDQATAHRLLVQIARCPNAPTAQADASHPCHRVVGVQTERSPDERHVPEPWNGSITSAPLLFISSNPSIDPHEVFPAPPWSDADISEFFDERFSKFIKDGVVPLRKEGTGPKGQVRYLVQVRAMARDIFGRAVVPGSDYALTEVVHCKSEKNIGVAKARPVCTAKWLSQILDVSGASVVVVLGKDAASAVRGLLGITESSAHTVHGRRHYLFLGAPGSNQPRKFARCVPDEATRSQIQAALG